MTNSNINHGEQTSDCTLEAVDLRATVNSALGNVGHLADDAVNAWIFAPQVATVARKGLRGVWMNYPIVVHDIAAMRWE